MWKWISFNAKVIGEKTTVINNYNTSIANLPKLERSVLELGENTDLESVARTRETQCETVEGDSASTATLQGIRECTALRVIPDALPATRNPEALLASLNKIFLTVGSFHHIEILFNQKVFYQFPHTAFIVHHQYFQPVHTNHILSTLCI